VRLIFAPGVRAEMQRIRDYIAGDNQHAAAEVFAEMEALREMLLAHPPMGRRISRSRRRRLPVVPYPYLIYYEAVDDMVRILSIRHAARFRRAFQEPQQVFAR
jgi:plasmid stabilization system protein ParE